VASGIASCLLLILVVGLLNVVVGAIEETPPVTRFEPVLEQVALAEIGPQRPLQLPRGSEKLPNC
jgi:hypothetical protein